jgi:hypothetical protein
MTRPLSTLIALAAAVLASAAQAQPAPSTLKPDKPQQRACFPARSVTNFAAADDRNLYVRVGVRDVYHLAMFGNCFDLAWVHSLALASRGGTFICEGGNVSVDVVTRDIGPGLRQCPVTSVKKLTAAEAAALPKRARP